MSDPLETMGLPASASDAEIRRRYLELVREFPPDRAPERFAEIHAAYESLKDPALRMERALLSLDSDTDTLEALEDNLRARLRNARFPVSQLVAWADSP